MANQRPVQELRCHQHLSSWGRTCTDYWDIVPGCLLWQSIRSPHNQGSFPETLGGPASGSQVALGAGPLITGYVYRSEAGRWSRGTQDKQLQELNFCEMINFRFLGKVFPPVSVLLVRLFPFSKSLVTHPEDPSSSRTGTEIRLRGTRRPHEESICELESSIGLFFALFFL